MDRFPVLVTPRSGRPAGPEPVLFAAHDLMHMLHLTEGQRIAVRLGIQSVQASVALGYALPPGHIHLSPKLTNALPCRESMPLSIWRSGPEAVTLGPLVGLLIARSKLAKVLAGKRDRIYCRYAQYAREIGGALLFLRADGLDPRRPDCEAFMHVNDGPDGCAWVQVRCPVPTVIYDRCFGAEGRAEAALVRAYALQMGITVVNHLPKITKLQAFDALTPHADLAPYLPWTVPMTPASLTEAMGARNDLYLKPDHLYKGKGVFRLTRVPGRWKLSTRLDDGNAAWDVDGPDAVLALLAELAGPDAPYLIQAGLDLATYLGNRFDFRSLVQKDGQGRWTVTGVVARIAADGSAITSPRSGGQVAAAPRVLSHAFGDRWPTVLADLEQASLLLAERLDAALGPCTELGLDVGITRAGRVQLIEANGKPLRVSLDRLGDPLIAERINRYPIHYAAHLAAPEISVATVTQPRAPLVGVLLGKDTLKQLRGPWQERYRAMVREARAAGAVPFFFDMPDVDVEAGNVTAWTACGDTWVQTTLPAPDVVYNRATFGSGEGRLARALLEELGLRHGTLLLNSRNAFSKLEVHDALAFFPHTRGLAPETQPLTDAASLRRMFLRHPTLFCKADHGSHGSDVLKLSQEPDGYHARGKVADRATRERFDTLEQLHIFLRMLGDDQPWVVQQGIQLPEVAGGLFDLRAILQKDGQAEWAVPLLLIRHGRPGSVATNMSQGAAPYLPESFQAKFGDPVPRFADALAAAKDAALKTALALESRYGLQGEIGVDLGLDTRGRPWVFEANSKPLHPQVPDLPEPLIRHPFDYACYLAARARAGRDSGRI